MSLLNHVVVVDLKSLNDELNIKNQQKQIDPSKKQMSKSTSNLLTVKGFFSILGSPRIAQKNQMYKCLRPLN